MTVSGYGPDRYKTAEEIERSGNKLNDCVWISGGEKLAILQGNLNVKCGKEVNRGSLEGTEHWK